MLYKSSGGAVVFKESPGGTCSISCGVAVPRSQNLEPVSQMGLFFRL